MHVIENATESADRFTKEKKEKGKTGKFILLQVAEASCALMCLSQ